MADDTTVEPGEHLDQGEPREALHWQRSILAALVIFIASALACAGYWISLLDTQTSELRDQQNQAEARVAQLNDAAAQHLDDTLRQIDIALRYLRTTYLNDPGQFDATVAATLAKFPPGMVQFATVFGPDGYLKYSSNHTHERVYFGDREHFRVPAASSNDALFISRPIIGRLSGMQLIQCTLAIRKADRFLGVIGIALHPEYLATGLASLRLDPSDTLSMVRLDGSIIARSHKLAEALKTTLPPDRPFFGTAPGARGHFRDTSAVDRIPMLFSWQHLAAWPIISVAAINEDTERTALARVMVNARARTRAAILLVMLFATAACLLILRIGRKSDELARTEYRNRLFLRKASDGVHILDESGVLIEASDAFYRMLGYRREEFVGARLAQWDAGFPAEELPMLLNRAAAGALKNFHTVHRRRDGSTFDVEVSVESLLHNGRINLYCSSRDITQRLKEQAQLEESEERFRTIADYTYDWEYWRGPDGRMLYVSPACERVSGYTQQEFHDNPALLHDIVLPEDREIYSRHQHTIESKREESVTFRIVTKAGQVAWIAHGCRAVESRTGKSLGRRSNNRDITDLKSAEDLAQRLATVDSLTELPNRRMLLTRLHHAMASARRYRRALALLYLDLDHFKQVNDSLGHDAGDALLVAVAARLRSCVRAGDLVARIGGDEFVVALWEIASVDDATKVADKILRALDTPIDLGKQSLRASASIGIASFDGQGDDDIDELLRKADAAMYAIKRDGRRGYQVFRQTESDHRTG